MLLWWDERLVPLLDPNMFFYMTDMTVKPEASYSTHHNIRAIVRACFARRLHSIF